MVVLTRFVGFFSGGSLSIHLENKQFSKRCHANIGGNNWYDRLECSVNNVYKVYEEVEGKTDEEIEKEKRKKNEKRKEKEKKREKEIRKNRRKKDDQ